MDAHKHAGRALVLRCTGVMLALLAAAPPAVRSLSGRETDAERKARVLAELDELLGDTALIRGREHIRVAQRAVYYDNPGGRVPRNYARDVRARVERIERAARARGRT